jgi:digeranylgeranylglycerophospholipid reductase
MEKAYSADVIVVGAGTAGCYAAWQLGKAGYRAIVLEAGTLTALGAHIEIFHMDRIRFDEFGIPHPLSPELIHTEEIGYTWSPDLKIKQPVRYTFYVMDMPAFIQRMQGYARDAGATIIEHARVESLIMEAGRLVGVSGTRDGEAFTARGKIVIDASGLEAAVRTRLHSGYGVENWHVPPEKCLFVCLELRDGIPAGFPTGSNSYLFHKAFWNKSWGDGAILGIGQPNGFSEAWRKHAEWRAEYFGNPGKVLKKRQGAIPYHRPPFSLVADNLMVIGDAACQNKPFSGEGVTSGFTAAKIAAEVAAAALAAGDTSVRALWAYNVRYFRGQGAKFAGGLAQLPAAAELTRSDVSYLFQRNIIFASRDFEELNRDYELRMGFGRLLRIGAVLIWGVVTGRFSRVSLKKFLAASGQAGKIKSHYLRYPGNPEGFAAWASEAAQLWGEHAT